MSPNMAKPRGTSPDVYIRYPKINPFPMPTMKPGPRTNVQLRTSTSALASATSEPRSPSPACCRNVTTARRLTTPIAIKVHSTRRAVPYPSLVLAPEDRKDHHGRADVRNNEKDFEEHAQSHPRVPSGASHEVLGVQHGVVEDHRRDREDERGEEKHAENQRGPPS